MIDKLGAGVLQNLGLQTAKTRESSANTGVSGLNKIENRLADQISLSDSTKQNLEQLKNLDRQLTRFADVLKGRTSTETVLNQLDQEEGIRGFISGFESRTSLEVSQIEAIQEVTALSAEINDEGELDLILTNVRETLSSNSFTLSSQQNEFLATFL